MAIDRTNAIQHLTEVLEDFQQIEAMDWTKLKEEPHHRVRVMTRMRSALARLAPEGSSYHDNSNTVEYADTSDLHCIAGVLQALLADYQGDYLQTFRELAHAELFTDFLAMAEYLISEESLKDPAAVLAGGVLEEHLRQLCDKNSISATVTDSSGKIRPKKLDVMNADLVKQTVYGKNEQKQITAWAGIRNDAAHAHYEKYVAEQVVLMIQGIRGFVSRYPA
jgi:hypothetical protein